jgi:hypothetical protein
VYCPRTTSLFPFLNVTAVLSNSITKEESKMVVVIFDSLIANE